MGATHTVLNRPPHSRTGTPEASPEPAPVFGRWRYWYAFAAGSLLFYIVVLTVFSRIFS